MDAQWLHDFDDRLRQYRETMVTNEKKDEDQDTLLFHRALWGQETSPVKRDLDLLTIDETAVYDALRHNVHAPNLRLEQERISFTHVRSVVSRQSVSPC